MNSTDTTALVTSTGYRVNDISTDIFLIYFVPEQVQVEYVNHAT